MCSYKQKAAGMRKKILEYLCFPLPIYYNTIALRHREHKGLFYLGHFGLGPTGRKTAN